MGLDIAPTKAVTCHQPLPGQRLLVMRGQSGQEELQVPGGFAPALAAFSFWVSGSSAQPSEAPPRESAEFSSSAPNVATPQSRHL